MHTKPRPMTLYNDLTGQWQQFGHLVLAVYTGPSMGIYRWAVFSIDEFPESGIFDVEYLHPVVTGYATGQDDKSAWGDARRECVRFLYEAILSFVSDQKPTFYTYDID